MVAVLLALTIISAHYSKHQGSPGVVTLNNEFEQMMNLLQEQFESPQAEDHDTEHNAKRDMFMRALASLAPSVTEQWSQYLKSGGELSLDQAMLGENNFALRKAKAESKANRDYAFLHWLHLERTALKANKSPPNLNDLARLYDPVSWESVAQEYRRYRKNVFGLPNLQDD
jgi:hypothetical protein